MSRVDFTRRPLAPNKRANGLVDLELLVFLALLAASASLMKPRSASIAVSHIQGRVILAPSSCTADVEAPKRLASFAVLR